MRNQSQFAFAFTLSALMCAVSFYGSEAAPALTGPAPAQDVTDQGASLFPGDDSRVFAGPRQLTMPPGLAVQVAPPPRRDIPSTFPDPATQRVANAGAVSVLPNAASCPRADLGRLAPPPVPGLAGDEGVLSRATALAGAGTPCPTHAPHTAPVAGATALDPASGPLAQTLLPGTTSASP